MSNTQTQTSGIAALEAGLARCQETARKSLELAESIDRARDDGGQDVAYRRALTFMKMTAKLGMALAKLNGSHSSNIRIHRTQTSEQEVRVEFPAPERREPAPGAKPLDPVTETRLNTIYDDWVKARAAKQGDVIPFDRNAVDDDADYEWKPPGQTAARAGEGASPEAGRAEQGLPSEARRAQEGPPLSNSSGSNGGK